jgi:hypothetical protein
MSGGLVSTPKDYEILVRAGGAEPLRIGTPWRRRRFDSREVEAVVATRADASLCATLAGANGALRTAAANKLRLSYTYDSVSLTWGNAGFLLESSRANLCLQSENFAISWTADGTPTLSAGANLCGALSLSLVGDDSGAATEGYFQVVGFTGNGVKAVSVYVAKGASPPGANGSLIGLTDTTAGVDRLRATVAFNGTVPVVTMVTGTLLRTVGPLLSSLSAAPIYRLEFQTAAVTAANTNALQIYGAASAADQGNFYVGGVQAENAAFPSSYIKTTAAAVTRAVDSLTCPFGFGPEDLTIYGRLVRPAHADAAGTLATNPGIIQIGSSTYPDVRIWFDATTRFLIAGIRDGTGTLQQASQAIPAGATIDFAVKVRNWSTGASAALDVGSGYGAFSATIAAVTAFSNQTLRIGAISATDVLDGALNRLLVARGLFTLAEMQAVAW